jgi:hypothetical protein
MLQPLTGSDQTFEQELEFANFGFQRVTRSGSISHVDAQKSVIAKPRKLRDDSPVLDFALTDADLEVLEGRAAVA